MGIEQDLQDSATFPCLQLILRQGIIETVINDDSVLHGTKRPSARRIEGHKARDRLASPGDDDVLAGLYLRQQPRQTGLGLMNIHNRQDYVPV